MCMFLLQTFEGGHAEEKVMSENSEQKCSELEGLQEVKT